MSRSVAVSDGTTILILGGLTGSGSTTGTILRFDPTTGHSVLVGRLAAPVHDAAGWTAAGSVLIFGGGNLAPESLVQQSSWDGKTSLVGRLPTARADLGAVMVDGMAMVVGGGTSGTLDRQVLATTDGTTFRRVARLAFGVRYGAVVGFEGRAYLFGGAGAAGDRTEIQRIDPATGRVDIVGQMPRSLSHASALVIGQHILIMGGLSRGTLQDTIWQFDPATGAVQTVGRLPRPISDFAAVVVGGVGFVIGGETTKQVASVVSVVIQ